MDFQGWIASQKDPVLSVPIRGWVTVATNQKSQKPFFGVYLRCTFARTCTKHMTRLMSRHAACVPHTKADIPQFKREYACSLRTRLHASKTDVTERSRRQGSIQSLRQTSRPKSKSGKPHSSHVSVQLGAQRRQRYQCFTEKKKKTRESPGLSQVLASPRGHGLWEIGSSFPPSRPSQVLI